MSHQLLSNACEAVEKQTELENFRQDGGGGSTTSSKHYGRIRWCSLRAQSYGQADQIEASREAEPLMRKLLNVLTSPKWPAAPSGEITSASRHWAACACRRAIPAC